MRKANGLMLWRLGEQPSQARKVPAGTCRFERTAVMYVVLCALPQVTDAIKEYIESKLTRALHNFGQEIKEVDVTVSARGGDTGTHGKR